MASLATNAFHYLWLIHQLSPLLDRDKAVMVGQAPTNWIAIMHCTCSAFEDSLEASANAECSCQGNQVESYFNWHNQMQSYYINDVILKEQHWAQFKNPVFAHKAQHSLVHKYLQYS